MTTPTERARALKQLRVAAVELTKQAAPMLGGEVHSVPTKALNDLIRSWRHYPWDSDINKIIDSCPDEVLKHEHSTDTI